MDRWKKEKQRLETAAATLLQEALRNGAEKAEVCLAYGAKTKIAFEKQDFHLASSDDGMQYGLRVLCQSRQGFTSGNSSEKHDLKEAAQTAVRIAKVSPTNEYYCIEPSQNIAKEAPDNFWDDSIVDLSLNTQRQWAKAFMTEAVKDPRFRLNEGTLSVDASLFLVMNSVGTIKFHRESACAWSLMAMASEGEQITSFDYFSELARTMDKLPTQLVRSAADFRDRIVANLKTGPAQSYLGAVVFSPRAVLDILARPLLSQLNGRTMVEGASRWKKADLNQSILSPLLTIEDTPWNTERFGAGVFDREGNPTSNRKIVDQGKLAGFLLDNYSARALQLPPTGNSVGGTGAIPTAGAHNVKVGPGEIDLKPWLTSSTRANEGVLLINRFSGRTDPTTGDFSGVAKGAEWWVKGERVYFAQDTSISGNLFEVLSKNLVGLTKQTHAVDCSGDSPYLIAEGVSVTSAKS